MHITGTLTTSGRGPLDGPGAPSSTRLGDGATYGGSGGYLDCQQQYYTAASQVSDFVTALANHRSIAHQS